MSCLASDDRASILLSWLLNRNCADIFCPAPKPLDVAALDSMREAQPSEETRMNGLFRLSAAKSNPIA